MLKKSIVMGGFILFTASALVALQVKAANFQTASKFPVCVSGGVGVSERESLHAHQESDSFWLITAAKKSGEFLSDVKVKIVDLRNQKEVISCVMSGPWLFVDLPLGQYDVEASYYDKVSGKEQKIKKKTRIHPQDHHQMLMYFDVSDRLS
jgi:hypothetical protein